MRMVTNEEWSFLYRQNMAVGRNQSGAFFRIGTRLLREFQSLFELSPNWDSLGTPHSLKSSRAGVPSGSQNFVCDLNSLFLCLGLPESPLIFLSVAFWGSFFIFISCSTMSVEHTFVAWLSILSLCWLKAFPQQPLVQSPWSRSRFKALLWLSHILTYCITMEILTCYFHPWLWPHHTLLQ